MLISPAAVWLAQQNGLALIRITVADTERVTGAVAEEGLAAQSLSLARGCG